MEGYKVAVLGATGVVGREMMRVMKERKFPVGLLLPLASEKSEGQSVPFGKETLAVHAAREDSFSGVDFVLGAVPSATAKRFAPYIVEAGAVFIDNSSAYRLEAGVPLVVPEINSDDVNFHSGIIANPNCATILALVAVHGIAKLSPIRSLSVTTYQAVSGAGAGGMAALEAETRASLLRKCAPPAAFPYPIFRNLIPQIGDFLENGYTAEEMKLMNESRKILHDPSLRVSCTCVRVPVLRSHSLAITVETEEAISVEAAREAIASSAGCLLVDEPEKRRYPMPLEATGQDRVLVGRIRRDLVNAHALTLFCSGDQLRKGAATNAVQIAELLLER